MGHTADNFDIDGTLNVDGAVTMASTLAVTGALTAQGVVLPVYQVVNSPAWYCANVIASQTNTAVVLLGHTVPTTWKPGRAGSVRSVIVNLESAWSAGALTVNVQIAGVTDTDAACAITSAVTFKRIDLAHGAVPFSATQAIGIVYTTDGDFAAGTTPEMIVTLEIDYTVAI